MAKSYPIYTHFLRATRGHKTRATCIVTFTVFLWSLVEGTFCRQCCSYLECCFRHFYSVCRLSTNILDSSVWGCTCSIFCRYSPRWQPRWPKFCSVSVSPSPSRDGCGTDWSAAGSAGTARAAWAAAPCSRMAPVLQACWGTCNPTTLAKQRKVVSGKNLQTARTAGTYILTNSHTSLQLSTTKTRNQHRIIT
jgi:hypothetical protein